MRKLTHDAIRAALTFVLPHELPHLLKRFLDHLGRTRDKAQPKHIEKFLSEIRGAPG